MELGWGGAIVARLLTAVRSTGYCVRSRKGRGVDCGSWKLRSPLDWFGVSHFFFCWGWVSACVKGGRGELIERIYDRKLRAIARNKWEMVA